VDVLDAALDELAWASPDLENGLSNHGPMASDALVRLGRSDLVLRWVADYQSELAPEPSPGTAIPRDDRDARLGDGQIADWLATYRGHLAARPWERVLSESVTILLPGLWSEAGHGLIRTAHAVRMLDDGVGPQRVDELARGLAVWATGWKRWPGNPTLDGSLEFPAAYAGVLAIPRFSTAGFNITETLGGIDDEPTASQFAAAVESLGLGADPGAAISAFTAAAARLEIANGAHDVIALVHSLTLPAALRLLLPRLDTGQVRAGLAAAWSSLAALAAGYGVEGPGPAVVETALTPEAVVAMAIDNFDEHAIKMAEACLREYAITPDGAYLEAAADVSRRIDW